jgi:hypothetical protein
MLSCVQGPMISRCGVVFCLAMAAKYVVVAMA